MNGDELTFPGRYGAVIIKASAYAYLVTVNAYYLPRLSPANENISLLPVFGNESFVEDTNRSI